MKALITGLIVIAVANLLAIGGFVGWLVQSDRLDMERVRELRQKVSVTLTQERADKAEQATRATGDWTKDCASSTAARSSGGKALTG